MEVMSPRCCGLDGHKREVVAGVVATAPDGTPHQTVRAFGTMPPDSLALADWLMAPEVTHVAMESTGVSRKPLGNLREDTFVLLLVNARHGKAVPGRGARTQCPAARPTGATASGWPTFCGTGCSPGASSPTGRSGRCGN